MYLLQIVALLAFLALGYGAAIPTGLEPQSPLNGRIVGGVAASIENHPWMVSVQTSGSHHCGGSIISKTIVVTAAHCLESPITASVLRIRAGSNRRSYGGVLVQVAAFKAHEGYNTASNVNDIAVLRLQSSLTFGSTIKAIALATVSPANGAAATVTGWGKIAYNSYTSTSTLNYIDTRIVSRSQCGSSSYSYGSRIKESMICAAIANKDSCNGDSGGPLVSGGQLVGVVSWGVQCAAAKYPGVYADVAELRSWILQAQKTV